MKAILYTLLTLSLITSCKSIDKMVEKGEYDKAFEYAIDKLAGEKNKETKYVKGLEKAYRELNNKDYDRVYFLSKSNRISKWEEVYEVYTKIERRTDKLRPLLPLVSKDGYEADFDIYSLADKKIEAANASVELYYNEGLKNMDAYYKSGLKVKARDAYFLFEKTKRFNPSYKDVSELMDKAEILGTTFVSVDFKSDLPNTLYSEMMENKFAELRLSRLDSKWERYSFFDKNRTYDKYVVISFEDIYFDKEKELNNNYKFSEVIEDGFENVYDKNGKVVVDSLGKAILIPRKVTVHAWVSEIFREKKSNAKVNVLVYNEVKANPSSNIPITAYHEFKDSAIRFTGDKRALNTDFRNRIDDSILNFPSDFEIAEVLSYNLLTNVENVIKDYNF